MKKIILFLLCLFSLTAQAQIVCGIWYDYDNAGNRIKRHYDCKDLSIPDHPDNPTSLMAGQPTDSAGRSTNTLADNGYDKVMLYPNPVQDKFYIRLPKKGSHTHFHLYDAKGAIITSGNIDTEIYEGNISNLPSGEYNIIVYYEDRSVPFKILKI